MCANCHRKILKVKEPVQIKKIFRNLNVGFSPGNNLDKNIDCRQAHNMLKSWVIKMDKLIAVVTGGTRGIGLAIAESLVKRNASLAITYKGEDKDALKARRHLESLLKEKQTHPDAQRRCRRP